MRRTLGGLAPVLSLLAVCCGSESTDGSAPQGSGGNASQDASQSSGGATPDAAKSAGGSATPDAAKGAGGSAATDASQATGGTAILDSAAEDVASELEVGADGAAPDAHRDAVTPGFCDSDAAAIAVFSPTYGSGHKHDCDPSDGEAWITYDSGWSLDVATGIGWWIVFSFQPLTDATATCAALTMAGLSDWRLPTIDEARSLAAGCAPTLPSGTCAISDPGCLTNVCGNGSLCDSCRAGQGPKQGEYCKPDTTICRNFHTSSACSDCGSSFDWEYSPTNGNFYPADSTVRYAVVCVRPGVPNAVP